MCNPCGYTMKISSRYHRLLIYDVKRTAQIDGMGPLNLLPIFAEFISDNLFQASASRSCAISLNI